VIPMDVYSLAIEEESESCYQSRTESSFSVLMMKDIKMYQTLDDKIHVLSFPSHSDSILLKSVSLLTTSKRSLPLVSSTLVSIPPSSAGEWDKPRAKALRNMVLQRTCYCN
jgi:hypothetical protein